MTSRTKLTAFNRRVDSLLQGIADTVLKSADRDLAIREAIGEYNHDAPRRLAVEFAGDSSSYYLLFGKHIDEGKGTPTVGIDLTSSGADSELGVKFTLDRTMLIQQFSFKLKRTGADVEGQLTGGIYTDASDLPDVLVATADTVDIDDPESGVPVGFYGQVHCELEKPIELPAGVYHAVLGSVGYTYANGTEEVMMGVVQGTGVEAQVSTSDGAWSVFSPDSEGMLEVIAATPGWRSYMGRPLTVEYPAADLSADEDPHYVEDDEWEIFLAANGTYLRFMNTRPSTGETIRLELGLYYEWMGKGVPEIETPAEHFEGLCYLSASICCLRLASKFGQKRSSTLRADVADRSQQGGFYRAQAKIYRSFYDRMLGLGEEAKKSVGASLAVADMDYLPTHGDYLFHGRKTR